MSIKSMGYGTALALAATLVLGGQAYAAGRGSADDQLACTPDVYRLCSSSVPDEDAIVACLNRNLPSLSPACKTVMTRPATPAQGDTDQDD
ncbi:hypothetical protein P7D22_01620 [Lichenihabitans sp. Uapishka_5]|uniref:hypothetical protein n=1 Tax=Lichenihabitans sp. Uapishka_5 TaxID=3037302 RepID=UPI0029E7D18D|nr:hypothetical protein [Lichenihabitans sp. Uapishka_5]MDX7949874.1 hypothetical protein [Lichenihabitans sp. Uapishka_5]